MDKLGRKYRTKDAIKKLGDIIHSRDRNLLSRNETRQLSKFMRDKEYLQIPNIPADTSICAAE